MAMVLLCYLCAVDYTVIHVSLIKPDWDSYAKKHHILWCPYCRSEIDENAIVCKYCGRDIR
jgi:hypothetical protein